MIRSAGVNDIPALIELETTLFDNPMSERMLQHELVRGRGWVYGEPFHGYVLVRSDAGLTDITRLGVASFAQGRGVGRALLDQALEGVEDAVLTVKKNNERALRLYRRYGFTIVAHLASAEAFVLRRRMPLLPTAG